MKEKFTLNEEQAQSFVLSETKTDDWAACKLACIRGQQGFACDATDVSKLVVTITCSWHPEGAPVNKHFVNVTRNAKSVPKKDMVPSDIIEPHTQRSWQFSRIPSEDLVLIMTLVPGSSTRPMKIAAVPEKVPPPGPVPVPLGYCVGRGGQSGVHLWGPLGEMCNGLPYWGPYLTTGDPPPPNFCSCVGHGGFEGVRLWGPQGALCGGNNGWGTYSEDCVSQQDLVLCGCLGHGKILEGHLLWGPKGANCGGMPDKLKWGKYSQYCVDPNWCPFGR